MLADISKLLPFFLHLSLIRYASPASCCKYSEDTAVPGCICAANTVERYVLHCLQALRHNKTKVTSYITSMAVRTSCRLSH